MISWREVFDDHKDPDTDPPKKSLGNADIRAYYTIYTLSILNMV